jgi:hypothetical protein
MPAAKPAGDKYFELTQEVDIPEPIKVGLGGTKSVIVQPPTRAQMRELAKIPITEIDARDEVVLGKHYEAIKTYYDTLPYQKWNDFTSQLSKHFFGPGADDVEGKSQDSSD